MSEFDPNDDYLDGVLFRFWIRAASYPEGWPGETAGAIGHCTTPAQYREALMKLALSKGVNLPMPETEVLHMASFFAHSVDTELAEHEAIIAVPEWKTLADRAVQALGDLYQSIGTVHLAGMPVPPLKSQ